MELQAKIARKSDQLAKLPAVEKFQLGVGHQLRTGDRRLRRHRRSLALNSS